MPFSRVRIEALAFELPEQRVSSRSIETELADTYKRLGIPQGCIEMLVGVLERRFWSDDSGDIASLASNAARAAYARSGRADELRARTGLVVSTSVSKDYVEPSVAALVRGQLQLPAECDAYDVGNACLGFLNGIDLASTQIELGNVDVALVVAAESSRHHVGKAIEKLRAPTATMADFKETLPTLTLGSGTVAMLLVRDSIASTSHRVVGSVSLGDPASSTICMGTSEWMKTDAQKLLVNGVDLAARTFARAREKLGWTRDNLAQLVCHQVGATHMATLFKKLELDLDKALLTYPDLGNIGPAAVPITLGLALEKGRVHDGDRLGLLGIGSGLSCMMTEIVW